MAFRFRLSNSLVGILNAITILLLSVPVLGAGIWLGAARADVGTTECERYLLPAPPFVIALGVFLVVISVAGLVGASRRVTSCLLRFYLCAMFILVLMLFSFTVVTNKGAGGEDVSGRGFDKEYWLENKKNWNKIRSCLDDYSKVCKTLLAKKWTQDRFFHADLLPLEQYRTTNESFNCHHMLSPSASGMFAALGKLIHIDAAQSEVNYNLHFDPTVQFIAVMILGVQAGRRLHKKNKSPRGKGATAATALLVLLAVAALPNGAVVAARPLHGGGGGGGHVQAASGPLAAAAPPWMMPKSLASSGRSSCTNDPNTMEAGPCVRP